MKAVHRAFFTRRCYAYSHIGNRTRQTLNVSRHMLDPPFRLTLIFLVAVFRGFPLLSDIQYSQPTAVVSLSASRCAVCWQCALRELLSGLSQALRMGQSSLYRACTHEYLVYNHIWT